MKKIISFKEILDAELTIEFFKGDNYHYAMIKVGDLGYFAGNGSDGVYVQPTHEFASHITINGVGFQLTYLLDLALNQPVK
jgi:hypothetical protein